MSDSSLSIIADRLKEPLGPVSIANRKQLMLFSFLGLIVTKLGVMPTKIAMLGIEFDASNQKTLLIILALGVVYYFCSFVVSIISDMMSWRVIFAMNSEKILMSVDVFDISHLTKEQVLKQMKLEGDTISLSKAILCMRLLIDIVIPVILSSFSFTFLVYSFLHHPINSGG
ncbi:hypothetical protein [Aeromonas allosaccharophila]|uniref:hypothetical protein n=1 Tax=Aeromonas allosaccharophila TaxID=656 RepID=UPI0012E00698|nr:hypothetical protein [Aeromonas allosaccharophila]